MSEFRRGTPDTPEPTDQPQSDRSPPADASWSRLELSPDDLKKGPPPDPIAKSESEWRTTRESSTELAPDRSSSGVALGEGNGRVAGIEGTELERGFTDSLRQFIGRVDRADRGDTPKEINEVIDAELPTADPREEPENRTEQYTTADHPADGSQDELFDGEPRREQTAQGRLGDCGVIAALGSVAGHRPEVIRECVRQKDDGNFEVRLHEAAFSMKSRRYEPTGRMINLTVTPRLPVFDRNPSKPAFADSKSAGAVWAPILEKAIAGLDRTWTPDRQRKWTDLWDAQGNTDEAPTGYVRLNQGSNPGDRAELLTQLTGQPAKAVEFPTQYDRSGRSPDRQLLDEIRGQLAEKKPVLVGTRSVHRNEAPLDKDLISSHAYEVTEVDENGMFHLRNPWNRDHPEPVTMAEFRANVRPRYTTLE